jgi:ABC-type transport system involved in cytochrome c biogenesis ATPase subunit
VNRSSVALRIALTGADDAFHARLRGRFGLSPSGAAEAPHASLAYCGREFRVYPSMSVGEASRFFGALNDRWNAASLRDDLARTGLGDAFEVRRMKRAYQRALVLAMAMATEPDVLVVESAEEFDEPGAAALLERSIARVSRALVTYAGEATPPSGIFVETLPADGFDVAWA